MKNDDYPRPYCLHCKKDPQSNPFFILREGVAGGVAGGDAGDDAVSAGGRQAGKS